MEDQPILSQLAYLQSRLDLAETELHYLNTLLIKTGFPEGINSLKQALQDVLDQTSIFDLTQEI